MNDFPHITYGFADTPFGPLIAARSEKGYTDVQFLDYNRAETIHELGARWGTYTPTQVDNRVADIVVESVFLGARRFIIFDFRGTPLELDVWRTLRIIPFGHTATYADVAVLAGHADDLDAVKAAVTANPLGLIIPCHRVVAGPDDIGDYHWGRALKQRLLDWEKREAPIRNRL